MVGLHGGVDFPVLPRFLLGLDLRGGYYFAAGGGVLAGGSAMLSAGGHAKYQITPRFSLGLVGSFRSIFSIVPNPDFDPNNPDEEPAATTLFQADAGLETIYHFGVPDLTPFALGEFQTEVIYPHLGAHYNSAALGTLRIRHTGGYELQSVNAELTVDGLTDTARPLRLAETIRPGSFREVTLLLDPSFAGDLAAEGGDAEAVVELSYRYRGWDRRQRLRIPVEIAGTADLAWDDPARLALFVHPEEETVVDAARRVADAVEPIGTKQLDPAVRRAAAAYALAQTLAAEAAESTETTPPTSAGTWEALSSPKETAAILPFARDVLLGELAPTPVSRAVLYAALFERRGTPAAFITVGDRLLVAAAMETPPSEIDEVFAAPDALIQHQGRSWFLLDPRNVDGGFLTAHQEAVAAVNNAEGEPRIVPLRSAWESYPPAKLHAQSNPPLDIDEAVLAEQFRRELAGMVEWEIAPRVAALERRLGEAPEDIDLRNELGVLYGRYNLYPQAQRIFSDILLDTEYVPTLLNAGSVFFAQGEMRRALPFYQRAFDQQPFNPNVLLGLAKVEHALENYGNTELAYQRLESIAPELAERYSYLTLRGEEARRAAAVAELTDVVEWQVAE
jgi:tetratricopeptide (TPR) repeat protein